MLAINQFKIIDNVIYFFQYILEEKGVIFKTKCFRKGGKLKPL